MLATPVMCDRCGQSAEARIVIVSIDRGPLHPTDPPFTLCERCSRSMDRWVRRGRRHQSKPASSSGRSRSAGGTHRSKQQLKKRRLVKQIALYVLFVATTFFFAWYMIKSANIPRPE
jgi:hypothetical protein